MRTGPATAGHPLLLQPRCRLVPGSPARRRRSQAAMARSAEHAAAAPHLTFDDLVAYIAAGCKPRSKWRIGTEHEKLGYFRESRRRIDYATIRQLLQGLCDRFGWLPLMEGEFLIGAELDGQSVTIEPGGQFELSGAPLASLHETQAELESHLQQVRQVADGLGVNFLALGFDPLWPVADVPIMPKNRYRIMRDYMPRVGSLGHDMMFRSTTIQVNIDFESEADMVEKLRVGLALQPVATALFANSPFRDGADTGFLSWRSRVWEDVDGDRCGVLPFVWEPGFGFARYAEFALDVPMYFAYRDGAYIDATQQRATFRDFLAGRLPALPGERPTLQDWELHLTTIFPEVRLKRYIEMRGGDGGPPHMITALSALWIGLLYCRESQAAAYALVRGWSAEEHAALRAGVPNTGLRTRFREGTVQDLARQVLALSRAGLQERGLGEEGFLDPLDAIAASGDSQADKLLGLYRGPWQGKLEPLYAGEHSFWP